jgi:hypothetical protein
MLSKCCSLQLCLDLDILYRVRMWENKPLHYVSLTLNQMPDFPARVFSTHRKSKNEILHLLEITTRVPAKVYRGAEICLLEPAQPQLGLPT